MTKKHFILVAEILRCIRNKPQRLLCASDFIKLAQKENPRFDKARFLEACDL